MFVPFQPTFQHFLLFWQLPVTDKMKYFEMEQQIADLASIQDAKERKRPFRGDCLLREGSRCGPRHP